MYYGKRPLILAALGAMLFGIILHFVYSWFPNAATALFSPINESIWEHVKIIFWPYLLTALWLNRGRPGGMRPWLLILPALCIVMLALGYIYHILLGGRILLVDIVIYFLIMGLGFWLPGHFSGPFLGIKWMLPLILVLVLGLMITLFTLWPPQLLLFTDLSIAGSWYPLPC